LQTEQSNTDDFGIWLRFNEEKTEISKCNPNVVRTIEGYNANESIHHMTAGLYSNTNNTITQNLLLRLPCE